VSNQNQSSDLLIVDNLTTTFHTARGPLPAVGGVSFSLGRNATLGVVGESGSGKTVLSRTIMGLQPRVNVEVGGSVLLDGHQIVGASDDDLRDIWGTTVAMIFQDPMTSLNPVTKVGKQIGESLRVRLGLSKAEAKERATELLSLVGIPSPSERYDAYPTQLSGGMRQRVMIAIALACNPTLLMADEPTTGLDVTIQAQILNLLDTLQAERQMSVMLVTHDLGVVATRTDQIIVMYAGRIVEMGTTRDVFRNHRMPYTRALLESTPRVSNPSHTRLQTIPGRPPNLLKLTQGCAFAPRCSRATEQCSVERPVLRPAGAPGHMYACWNPLDSGSGDIVRSTPVATAPIQVNSTTQKAAAPQGFTAPTGFPQPQNQPSAQPPAAQATPPVAAPAPAATPTVAPQPTTTEIGDDYER
jgi:peptide/nickel transport system ATP-binding protein